MYTRLRLDAIAGRMRCGEIATLAPEDPLLPFCTAPSTTDTALPPIGTLLALTGDGGSPPPSPVQ